MKDCTTCKYGYEDERLGIPMCHHPKGFSEDCVDFNMHEEKKNKESEKPSEDLEKAADEYGSDGTGFIDMTAYRAFIAGAEWQKERMMGWSEKDEAMIERLIRHTQKEFDELCNDRYGHQEIISDLKESCRERMNWLENRLKSLRPSWKPSEEQMRCLEMTLTNEAMDDNVHTLLTELYEQLKKIKEDGK